ncbi:MAG: hypothetical protein PHH83_00045 [Patescibacteria group bacterium]|nr:hypothetical protein [Patescibacteria group bacterium]
MLKISRNFYPEVFYHIYNRGVDKRKIFYCRRDYLFFINRINFYRRVTGVIIVSYCLLPNHYHFILREPPHPMGGLPPIGWGYKTNVNPFSNFKIPKFMGLLANSYTKYFNNKKGRSGRLFEFVFKSREINKENQLSNVVNYIIFNPLKHGLVNNQKDWKYTFVDDKKITNVLH